MVKVWRKACNIRTCLMLLLIGAVGAACKCDNWISGNEETRLGRL